MASKVKITIEVEADDKSKTKGVLEFSTETYRIKSSGEVYPWVIRSLMRLIDDCKDQLDKPKET